MKRKPLYVLLATPVVALVVYLAIVPAETRGTFLTEFKYRIAALFGYEPEPIGEELGLRSEHPEEYGPQADAEEESPAESPNASGADASVETGDAVPDESSADVTNTVPQPAD